MRYAVIPTHNRPAELQRLVGQLRSQVDVIVIIDNASDPPVWTSTIFTDDMPARLHTGRVIRDEMQPPELYRMWNVAFDAVAAHAIAYEQTEWDVAVLNDDSSVPEGWFDVVSHALRSHPTAAAASTPTHAMLRQPWFSVSPGEGGLMYRMCPWAWVVRGELALRADETMKWWWGDTDFDWKCRQSGGVLIVPGPIVVNTLANSTTHGELMEQAVRDRHAFAAKWGGNPW